MAVVRFGSIAIDQKHEVKVEIAFFFVVEKQENWKK